MLQTPKNHDNIIVTPRDKELGTDIIKSEKYTQMKLYEHLSDKGTHKRRNPDEWRCNTEKIQYKIGNII